MELPYPDAKVAASLCIGGPCRYVLVENCGLLDEWLLEYQYVVPNISLQYPRAAALTLAQPLWWASFESTLQEYLTPALTRRIQSAYGFVRRLPQGKNPVKKRLVVVTGSEAELYIDGIDAEFMHTVGQEDGSGGVGEAQVGLTGVRGTEICLFSQQRNKLLGLYGKQKETQRDVKQLQAQVELMAKDICKLSTAFKRFSRIPGQRFRGSGVPPVAVVPLAVTAPTTNGIDAEQRRGINQQQTSR